MDHSVQTDDEVISYSTQENAGPASAYPSLPLPPPPTSNPPASMDQAVQTDKELTSYSTHENARPASVQSGPYTYSPLPPPSRSNPVASIDQSVQTEDELTSHSTQDNDGPGSHSTGMFSNSQNLTVTAQRLTNVTKIYNTSSTVFSDFRTVPRGEIDLQHEIRVDQFSEVVYWGEQRPRCSVRRVNSAIVQGRKFTVAVYQGDSAEEDWREDVSLYSALCHPNFVQLWGLTTTSGIHAAIFHDDLIPLEEFLGRHRNSPVLTVYIWAFCSADYFNSRRYFASVFQGTQLHCTVWIRSSTGRLCVDPVRGETTNMFYVKLLDLKSNPYTLTSLNAPGMESMAVNSLTLDQYHRICWFNLTQHRNTPISPAITMDLSAVLCWPSGSQFQDSVQIASIPDAEIPPDSWQCSWTKGAVMGDVMENGWTRYHCSDALLTETFTLNQSRVYNCSSWLCQANYVFTRLQITSNLENYGIVEDIDFCVDIAGTIEDLPAGYLFLCPVKHFRTGSSSYRWPACPAYWSLDPTGTEHLSNEEATRLGFPTISLKTSISFLYWDASVYAGLRKFHQAKGFDPDSQEVARHLGQLLELVGEEEVPLGRADEPSDFWADNEDWNLGFVDLDDPLNLPDKDNVLWDEED